MKAQRHKQATKEHYKRLRRKKRKQDNKEKMQKFLAKQVIS